MIALIACSKSKRLPATDSQLLPAAELYTGPLYRAQLAYAHCILGLPNSAIFILSARYGLLSLEQQVQSYELTLANLSTQGRREWGERVVHHLAQRIAPCRVYLLAGEQYRRAVSPLLEGRGFEIVIPLAGRGGYARQVQWLTQQIADREIKDA